MTDALQVDAAKTVAAVEDYIRRVVAERGADGVLLGLSGGIDSTLVATLAVRALGPERVHVIYLYDHLNSPALARRAERAAAGLGLKLEMRSIEAALRKKGNYRAFGIRASTFSDLPNRLFLHVSRLVVGESTFFVTLRDGAGEPLSGGPIRRWFQKITREAHASGHAKHQYRRKVAETEARRRNLQLIGAGNRSEWLTGYFTTDGIDDVDVQPIGGLYKTQVRQLAAYLDVPEDVRRQPPSPDGMKGLTDERDIGMTYRKIDLVLDHLAGGLSRETIARAGCTETDMALVREMNRLSAWMRRGTPPYDYAVDGGPGSALRV